MAPLSEPCPAFWKRWSSEYLTSLRKTYKWHQHARNIAIGDVLLIREDGLVPTKWPLARVTEVYPGKDHIVLVVWVKTNLHRNLRPSCIEDSLPPSSRIVNSFISLSLFMFSLLFMLDCHHSFNILFHV